MPRLYHKDLRDDKRETGMTREDHAGFVPFVAEKCFVLFVVTG
jgi:hypothetical protein